VTSMGLLEIAEELDQIDIVLARRSNLNFTVYTNDQYEVNWHHRLVASALDRVLAGKCRRLMIFEPPQNGKSEQVSRRFPAYAFGKNPDLKIIACSYNASLAQDMSRDVQKIMSSNQYRALFPNTRLAEARFEKDPVTGRRTHAEKRTQGQFDIVGHKGAYIAAGVAGPITGKTANIGIIDDPVKNRAEAESEIYRDRVWEWYKSAFSTRQFGDQGAIIICLTRWHTDDLAGRLLELAKNNSDADKWEVISLPAICEEIRSNDPRQIGEALWPEKYPLTELVKRRALGEYDFAALYQQTPAPSGGGLFKETWFAGRILDAAPAIMRVARGWDTAGTELGGDYTVGVKIGEEFLKHDITGELKSTGRFIVLDVVRDQLGPSGVDQLIQVTADLDGMCAQREEKEGGSAGLAVVDARTKTLVGKDYAGVTVTGSKVTRSKPFRAQCEGGNVYLLRADWNTDYIKELCAFPTGKHDDQVDASSCAFNSVLLEPPPVLEWVTW
jgi:predicted phage terminase large subunit-like protein